jgi:uncharacterized protein YkwD
MSNILTKYVCILSVSVLALAAPVPAAHAATSCDLSNGLALGTADFQTEAKACLSGAVGITANPKLEAEMHRLTGVARKASGRKPVQSLASFDAAARVHAMDMAARNYAAHTDPEGRNHLDRVRQLDRQNLIGAFGANVVIVPAGTSAKDIQLALLGDAANAENVLRRSFDHLGVGIVEKGGMLYVVQVFGEVAGKLSAPLGAAIKRDTALKASLEDAALETVSWSIVSPGGRVLAKGRGARLDVAEGAKPVGYLMLDVKAGKASHTLKGPAVSVF